MAICHDCAGKGRHLGRFEPIYFSDTPCPECQGSGIVSCCDTAGAAADVSVVTTDNPAPAPCRKGCIYPKCGFAEPHICGCDDKPVHYQITDKGLAFMANRLGDGWESMTLQQVADKILNK